MASAAAVTTGSSVCNEYPQNVHTRPQGSNGSWNLLYSASDEPNTNYYTPPPDPPCDPPAELAPRAIVQSNTSTDPLEQVVVQDGQVFYIRYVDEPTQEITPQPQGNGEQVSCDTELCLENELSMLMENIMCPESAIPVDEPEQCSSRDWINYDELPLLNQHVHCRTSGIDTLQHLPSERFRSIETPATPDSSEPIATLLPDFSHYCVECEKFFPSLHGLQEHMEVNHRLIDESQARAMTMIPRAVYNETVGLRCTNAHNWPSTTTAAIIRQSPRRPFFCDACNISFDFVHSFYMHNYSVHGGTDSGW